MQVFEQDLLASELLRSRSMGYQYAKAMATLFQNTVFEKNLAFTPTMTIGEAQALVNKLRQAHAGTSIGFLHFEDRFLDELSSDEKYLVAEVDADIFQTTDWSSDVLSLL